MKYTKAQEHDLGKRAGAVVPWDEGVVFRCPCDERQVYVASPPHTISFGADGALTLDGSVGMRAHGDHERNWCHFWIKGGVAEMCADAGCLGKEQCA